MRAASPPGTRPGAPVVPAWAAAAIAVLLALWVQRRAAGAWFTPDDLVQLEQARGLLPWPVTAWRWLSGVAWARFATSSFGADPLPYHVANLAMHGANVALLFALARRWGASLVAAFAAALLYGASRVHATALASGASAGEFLALGLLLAALLAAGRAPWRMVLAAALALLALLAKESVLLVPAAALLLPADRTPGAGRMRWALPALALAAGGALLALGRTSGRLGGEAYAVGVGAHVPRTLGLLMAWCTDLATAIPDQLGATRSPAWLAGLLALALLGLAAWAARRRAPLAAVGAAWWLLAVAPVLPLVHQLYLHYLVAPAAGLALAVAGFVDTWREPAAAPGAKRAASTVGVRAGAIVAAVLAFALWNDHLLAARWNAKLPGTSMPADPVLRKSDLARSFVADVRARVGAQRAKVAFLILEGTQDQLDLATGEVRAMAPGQRVRDVVETTLGERGEALRAVLPNVDSVAFVRRLDSPLAGFELFFPAEGNRLVPMGRPPAAFERFGSALIDARLPHVASPMLDQADRDWPGRPKLLWLRAVAYGRLGQREPAFATLREIVRIAPADSFAILARRVLANPEVRPAE